MITKGLAPQSAKLCGAQGETLESDADSLRPVRLLRVWISEGLTQANS